MSRADWLEWRRGGLGGSDVAAVLGVSPWRSEFDVWASKTQPVTEERDRPEQRTGRRLESAVLGWLAEDLGGELLPVAPVEGPRPLLASPDGLLGLASGSVVGLEAKTSADRPWAAIPVHYELQCRVYLAVMGVETWHLGCYFKRRDDWRRYEITRDLEIEAALIARCTAWWDRHVIGGEPPPLIGPAASRWLQSQHPAGAGWTPATSGDDDLAARYLDAQARERAAHEEREALGLELRARIGDAEGLRGSTWRARWSRFERSHFDRERLSAEHPDLAAQYISRRPSDRLTVE